MASTRDPAAGWDRLARVRLELMGSRITSDSGFVALLRQPVDSRVGGCPDTNGGDSLS